MGSKGGSTQQPMYGGMPQQQPMGSGYPGSGLFGMGGGGMQSYFGLNGGSGGGRGGGRGGMGFPNRPSFPMYGTQPQQQFQTGKGGLGGGPAPMPEPAPRRSLMDQYAGLNQGVREFEPLGIRGYTPPVYTQPMGGGWNPFEYNAFGGLDTFQPQPTIPTPPIPPTFPPVSPWDNPWEQNPWDDRFDPFLGQPRRGMQQPRMPQMPQMPQMPFYSEPRIPPRFGGQVNPVQPNYDRLSYAEPVGMPFPMGFGNDLPLQNFDPSLGRPKGGPRQPRIPSFDPNLGRPKPIIPTFIDDMGPAENDFGAVDPLDDYRPDLDPNLGQSDKPTFLGEMQGLSPSFDPNRGQPRQQGIPAGLPPLEQLAQSVMNFPLPPTDFGASELGPSDRPIFPTAPVMPIQGLTADTTMYQPNLPFASNIPESIGSPMPQPTPEPMPERFGIGIDPEVIESNPVLARRARDRASARARAGAGGGGWARGGFVRPTRGDPDRRIAPIPTQPAGFTKADLGGWSKGGLVKFQEGGQVGDKSKDEPMGFLEFQDRQATQAYLDKAGSKYAKYGILAPIVAWKDYKTYKENFEKEQQENGNSRGGLIKLQEGGVVDGGMKLEEEVIAAVLGQHPNPDEVFKRYIDVYGEEGFMELLAMIEQMIPQQGRMVDGAGGGLDDAIPAMIDGEQPAALSKDEYVIPADVVAHAGDGSSEAGGRKFDNLVSRVRKRKTGTPTQPQGMELEEVAKGVVV